MLEHMTLATAATGLIGLGIGVPLGYAIRAAVNRRLRKTLAARDKAVDGLTNRIIDLKRDLGRKNAEIVEMAPHAEVGRKHLAQRQIALAAANAANARRAAEKAAGNVRPIKARG